MGDNQQLSIPEAATRDSKAVEVLRVWLAGEQQHVSIRVGVWDDPAGWGIMLADLARHVASSYQQSKGFDRFRTLQRIKAGLDAELASPTDEPTGRVSS
ncbi:MAG: DUF5076 domain-containing protein [Candidatus Sulfotelmatobacter sp.]